MSKYNYGAVSESADVQPVASKKKYFRTGLICSIIGVICITVGVISFCNSYFDSGFGSESPEAAAVGFVNNMDEADMSLLDTYLPPAIRNSGFMSDSMNMSEIRSLDEKYDITLSNIAIGTIADIGDKADGLETGLKTVYDKTVAISDAKSVHITSDMSYVIDNRPYQSTVDFNLICIKVNTKWYVYTGATSDDIIKVTPLTTMGSVGLVDSIVKPDEVVDDTPAIVKDVLPLSFYEKALDDLLAGNLIIDAKRYVMPVKYSDMTSFYTLVNSEIKDVERIIKPNHILKHLPIALVKDEYATMGLDISIANTERSSIDVTTGTVTTLYVGKPISPVQDYPLIYLPGNVTFGTSYADVVKMYGKLDMYVEHDDVIRHEAAISIYQLDLANKYNHLYLQFDAEDKLVAIQWHYYDLNDFTED
ncbi:hypothetical protein J6A31_04790 [bacterium]|nr:hypothetical protein [bacterium]